MTDLDKYTDGTDLARYTAADLESAKNRSQLIGWAQGGGAVIAAGIALNLLGWIPMLVVVGGVSYVLYKLLTKGSD